MQEAENTKVVQDAYAAFGRNDIPTLMTYVADDIVWVGVYGTASHVPTSGERRGKAAVDEFFKQVAEHVHFNEFEPKSSSPRPTKSCAGPLRRDDAREEELQV